MLRSSVRFWVLAGLLAANLVVGVLSLYFVRWVNQRYAALFEHGAPVIYELRTLTREVTGVQRLARRIVSPEHETDWAGLLPQIESARDGVSARVGAVGEMAIFQDTSHPAAIDRLNREYLGYVTEFLRLAHDGQLERAAQFNLGVLRPGHDRFQQTLDAAADHVEREGRDLRDRYARDSRFFGGVSLAFASVPLVAVSVGGMVMTALIGLLLLVVINPRPDRRY
ncbi:MAG TPA: hypothetical protein VHN79_02010 [Lacunisphaera sp.]|nr:hypothetical protein [Lacunisphaera sp.]